MSALKKTDLTVIKGDALVPDWRLGERLGYERPRKVREIIKRNVAELERYGTIALRRGDAQIGNGATREVTEHLLNEEQALLICMFSNTAKAADVREEIVRVFMAWRRGETMPAPRDPFDAWRNRAETLAATVQALETARGGSVISLTNAPIWKNGRRPAWWSDIEVREFLTVTHRQMALHEVVVAAEAKFGKARTPRKTSIHNFWQRLDGLFSGGSK